MRYSRFVPVDETGKPLWGGLIAVEERANDWMAYAIGIGGAWAPGATPHDAVTKLLKENPELVQGVPQ